MITYIGTLKDVSDSPVLVHQREIQLAQRHKYYQWQKFPDTYLPSAIDTTVAKLPPDEKFERVKSVDFYGDALKAGATLGLTGVFTSLENLHGYEKFANALGTPQHCVYETFRWTSDVEFGRQMLNGVNPVVIRKCTSLPANFPVTHDMVKGFLTRGLTLQEEMEVENQCIITMHIVLPK